MEFEITRGDTAPFKFQRKNKSGTIITEQPTNIWFTLKKTAESSKVLVQKRLSNGTIAYDAETQYYKFTLLPEDTDSLDLGQSYQFDIEVKTGTIIKTIAKGKIVITDEVTHASDEVMDDGV